MDKIQIVYRYIILYYMHKRSGRRLFYVCDYVY